MLALTRRVQETVTILTPDGSKIEVLIIGANQGKIRLGFDAPKDYIIMRNELLLEQNGCEDAPQE